MVKCVFDARWMGEHGIGRFATEIASRLPHNPLRLVTRPMSPLDPFRLSVYPFKRDEWLISPGYNAPLLSRVPYLITIHDLNHIDRPENSSVVKRLYYSLILRRLCRRARAVLTVSEYSKRRISEWAGITSLNIFNVGNGVSPHFKPTGARCEVHGTYLFCVSNRRGHKNEMGLLHAFARAKLPPDVKLVLTGKAESSLLKLANELGIAPRLVFVGMVSEDDLASLYRGAVCLVFPSFYEGFGLPIVEAFACGTPVITSNVTSMPEIAGDAALLVNPHDIDEIAEVMGRLYESPQLRNQLANRGLDRVKHFTWDAVADRVKAAVQAVDNDPARPLSWN